MWERADSQEVGLEAATLERVRNSSLVECSGADNVTGLSQAPKLRTRREARGRGASRSPGSRARQAAVERPGVRMPA
jgi:hypothetical protein